MTPPIKSVDDGSFEDEVLRQSAPVLVCFYTEQGGLGDVTKRIAQGVARTRGGAVKIVLMDVDKAPKTSRAYGALTTPTFILFQGNQKRVTAVGYQRETDLNKLLDRFLEREPGQPEEK
jgi:thioredoxin 1